MTTLNPVTKMVVAAAISSITVTGLGLVGWLFVTVLELNTSIPRLGAQIEALGEKIEVLGGLADDNYRGVDARRDFAIRDQRLNALERRVGSTERRRQ